MKNAANISFYSPLMLVIFAVGKDLAAEPHIEIDFSEITNYLSSLSWAQNLNVEKWWGEEFAEILKSQRDGAIHEIGMEYVQKVQNEIETKIHKIFQNFNTSCQQHMGKMISSILFRNITENSVYFKMMDYSAKLTQSGMLSANFILLGDYEGCLDLEGEDFLGQYCVVSMKRQWAGYRPLIKDVHASFGICVPSSCTESDFRKTLHGKDIQIGTLMMLPGSCQTKVPSEMDPRAYNVFCAVIAYIAILIFCTLMDIQIQWWTAKKSSAPDVFKAFSLYTNVQEFLKPNESFEFLKIFNGLRVTLMTVVIFAHGYFSFVARAVVRPRDYGKHNYTHGPILLSSQPVDVFFLMSGALMTMQILGDISRGFKVFIRKLIARSIRLMQMMGFMVFVLSPLFPYFARGPLGFETWDVTKFGCEGIEWRFLTFTSSLMDSFKCHPHLWHLSTDMQLSLISPVFILLAVKYPKHSNIFTIIVIFGLAVICAIRYYIYDLEINIMTGDHPTFLEYSKWWVRLGPYLMGMLLGKAMFFEAFTKKKRVLSKEQKMLGWTVAIISLFIIYLIGLTVSLSTTGFRQYTAAEGAVYKGVKKILLPLSFSWLIYANFHGSGGFLGRILSSSFFLPFAKASLSFFIIHLPYQLFKASQMWSPVEFHLLWSWNDIISDYITVSILSVILHLTFEVPMSKITTYILNLIWPLSMKKAVLTEEETKKTG